MKRLIIQLILAILIPMAANANELCKMTSTYADATSGEISFEVEVKEAGTYFLQLWQCPAKLSNGQLQSYTIEVDGKRLTDSISPQKTGWGYLLSSNPISATQGKHNISVKSSLPAIPNVEFVELISAKSTITRNSTSPTKYDNYITLIERNASLKLPGISSGAITQPKDTATLITGTDLSTTTQIPYDYYYRNIPWFGYTFYTTAYFKEGQQITCTSSTRGNISHFMEIFSSTAPEKHSWVKLSDDDGIAQISIAIPASGIYYVKVRPFKNGSTGLCNLNINDIMSYENVPMCTMGVSGDFKFTTKSYNIFTANSESDPVLWVNMGGTYDGFVYAFNDDYESSGDFDWKKNARIKDLSPSRINKILVSSARSFDPIVRGELYIGCKPFYVSANNSFISGTAVSIDFPFKNLKSDDALISAPRTGVYNCFAWTGGICSDRIVPDRPSSPYYVPGGTALDAYDNYYYSERYPGCTRYIRSSRVDDDLNSGIDLWATGDAPTYVYTHASINKTSDSNLHGYDWESKLGSDYRIFHPRNALTCDTYGRVVHHYVPIDENGEKISLEEAIANDVAIMDNPVLSEYQEHYISAEISAMTQSAYNDFNSLYDKWQDMWDNSFLNTKESIQNTPVYQAILQRCISNPACLFLIYDKINKGINSAMYLFEDLIITNNSQNTAKMRAIHQINNMHDYDEKGRKIIRTNCSNLKLLLKQMLPESSQRYPNHSAPAQYNDIPDENSQYSVHVSGNQVMVDLTLDRNSSVFIDVLDLDCNNIDEIKGTHTTEAGNYNFTSKPLNPGTYLIRCLINGCLRVKKVFI